MVLTTGWIVTIILGVTLIIFIIAFLVWFYVYRKCPGASTTEAGMPKTTNDKWDDLLKEIERDKLARAESR